MTKEQFLPNGRWMPLDMIDHPGAVCIVPFARRDQVLLIRQYRPVIKKYLYEFPAGTLEAGESPASCARRELIEETGFAARAIRRIGMIYPLPAYSNEIIVIYRAERLFPCQGVQDPDEIIRVHPATRADVRRLLARGLIRDAKTISALGFCGWYDHV
ncbi:MAG: NUDIX hydrolase [Candidatus Omnitrophota bacterium]|nr:NUDIX hydrolase [Candidatus Omnitrophota bacterium]